MWTYDPLVRPESEVLDVGPQECVGWELRWGLHDEQGRPPPDGGYRLRSGSTGHPISGHVVEVPFQIGETCRPPTPRRRGSRPPPR